MPEKGGTYFRRIYSPGKTQRFAAEQEVIKRREEHVALSNGFWGMYDLPLQRSRLEKIFDSDDDDSYFFFGRQDTFEESFRGVLPKFLFTLNMKHFIENTLKAKKGKAIGIELGGPGHQLFQGFSKEFFKHTIGIDLTDHRTPAAREFDDKRHHEVMRKDLLNPDTFVEIKEKLNGEKVDLIIERMQRGLQELSDNPYLLTQRFCEWYSILNDNGIFFAQIPPILEPIMKLWVEKVKQQTNGTIDIAFATYKNKDYTVMRLIKHSGAPENIPLLSPRELRTAYLTATK